MNTKASLFDVITVMISVFTIMIIVITTMIIWNNIKTPLRDVNPTQEVNVTITGMANVEKTYDYIGIGLWCVLAIASFCLAALAGANPLFAIAGVVMIVIEIIVAIGLRDAYTAFINDPTIAGYASSLTLTNTLFTHLPKLAVIMAVISGIVMYLSTRGNAS